MTEATKPQLPNLGRLGTWSGGGRTDRVLDGLGCSADAHQRSILCCRATREGCREACAKAPVLLPGLHAKSSSHMPFVYSP